MEIIAVATTDGVRIDEHFGRASKFHIYSIDEENRIEEKEVRLVKEVSGDTHEDGLKSLAEQLEDVDIVLSTRIGPGAEAALNKAGSKSFVLSGNIEAALKKYISRRHLLENIVRSDSKLFDSCTSRSGCGGCGYQAGGGNCNNEI